jgi:cellulose 1,4-beta-cellobiosidase
MPKNTTRGRRWIKPPGESDGSSKVTTAGNKPDAEGKRFDPNCDATNPLLDAAPNAPPAGSWFHAEFMQLLKNAQPPISTMPYH